MTLQTMMLTALVGSGCSNVGTEDSEQGEPGVEAVAAPLQNGTLVDVSGAVVEIVLQVTGMQDGLVVNNQGFCTATLINQNTLVTAAHCSGNSHMGSYYPNMQVLYQENSTTWRCLTNRDGAGNTIRGSHDMVLASCPGRTVGFGSMFDYGTDRLSFPGNTGTPFTVFRHDFAVAKVWDAGFTWVDTTTDNYAAFYTGTIYNGTEYAYGRGATAQEPYPNVIDNRVRTGQYNVIYNDTFVLGAFGHTTQVCSGDSGGPIGVFLSQPTRYAVVGVLAADPQQTNPLVNNPVQCGVPDGATYWANAVSRIWYVEMAINQTCSSVNHSGVVAKECWH
jgi:hypothetical protein